MNGTGDGVPSPARATRAGSVRVWDRFVRIFHWGVVVAFATAWLSAEESDVVHEAAGYAIAGLVAARVVWGFAGTRNARFASFVRGPATVIAFLRDSLRFRARRYVGHNPAGGAMVVALLAMLATVTGSGIMLATGFSEAHWVEEAHEIAANVTLALVALHIAGVILASIEHRENLVSAMFSGRKRADPSSR